jgi:hypothetical protein
VKTSRALPLRVGAFDAVLDAQRMLPIVDKLLSPGKILLRDSGRFHNKQNRASLGEGSDGDYGTTGTDA